MPACAAAETDRTRENGILHIQSEEGKRGIGRIVFRDRVHVNSDFLPCFKVADRDVAAALCAGARNLSTARSAVADRAGGAVGTDVRSCLLQKFFVCHKKTYLEEKCIAADMPAAIFQYNIGWF